MRRYVHVLRSRADAIITGIGTVLADDPQLNCRNEGLANDSPPVFVFDSQLRMPLDAALVTGAAKLGLFCDARAPISRRQPLLDAGVRLIDVPLEKTGNLDVHAALSWLGAAGINHVLLEAGTGLVTSFIQADAVDRIYWTQSNHILGDDALGVVGPHTVNAVALSLETKYIQSHHEMIGPDRLIILNPPRIQMCTEQA